MSFITQGKTNWKFLLIVVVLAAITGGGILWFNEQQDSTKYPGQSAELSDEELLEYAKSSYNKEEMMFKDIIIGTHSGVSVRVTFPCSDVCPEYTTRVIRYDVDISECNDYGGIVKAIYVPCAEALMPEEFCFPKVIVDNNIYEFVEMPQDETADWQTYRNDEYGFEIKYPKDWTIQRNILGALDIYKSFYDYNCSVEVYADTFEYLYPIEEAEGYFQPFSESEVSAKEESIFIGNIPGKKLFSPGLAGREIYYLKEEVKSLAGKSEYYNFNIFLDVYRKDPYGESIIEENKCRDIFEKILSTFQFTKEGTVVERSPDVTCSYKRGELETRFYDSQGRMTGIKDGKIKEEIPGSYYIPRDLDSPMDCPPNCYEIYIPEYIPVHKFEIFSIEKGNYILEAGGGDYGHFSAEFIPIISGLTHVYLFDWALLAKGEEGVAIFIDLNGDGIFEKSITSNNDLTCEEFIIQLKKR